MFYVYDTSFNLIKGEGVLLLYFGKLQGGNCYQGRYGKRTPVYLIIIPVCFYLFWTKEQGGTLIFQNILTITLLLINEIQIFFLLCTILNKSFNLIIILLFYDNWFNFQRLVLLLGFGNLAGWQSYFFGTIIRHTRVIKCILV